MERIDEILRDPAWWFTAVFIAIVASLIGALIKDALLNVLAKISKSYRVRKQKRDKDLEDEINQSITNPSLLILRFCKINHNALLTVFIGIVFFIGASIILFTTTNENKGIIFYIFMCFSIISGVLSIIRCYNLLPQIHIMYTTYNKYREQVLKSLAHQTASGNSKNNTDDTSCLSNLSDVARDIIKFYLSNNETALRKNEMFPHVSDSKIKLNAALNELLEADILNAVQERANEPRVYKLTESGTKYLADGLLL